MGRDVRRRAHEDCVMLTDLGERDKGTTCITEEGIKRTRGFIMMKSAFFQGGM